MTRFLASLKRPSRLVTACMQAQEDDTEHIPAPQNFLIDDDEDEELDDASLIAYTQAAEQAIAARSSQPTGFQYAGLDPLTQIDAWADAIQR